MSTQDYRQSDDFIRNREMWKHKFIDKWSLWHLSAYYGMPQEKIKELIERQKTYFQQEYA